MAFHTDGSMNYKVLLIFCDQPYLLQLQQTI